MEEMIERWGWCERIEAQLTKNAARLSQDAPLYHLFRLSSVDMRSCASRLLECVKAAMCKGQSLVAVSDLKAEVLRVVLPLLHRTFLQALGADQRVVSASEWR